MQFERPALGSHTNALTFNANKTDMTERRKRSKGHHIYVHIGEIIIPDRSEKKRSLFRIKKCSYWRDVFPAKITTSDL